MRGPQDERILAAQIVEEPDPTLVAQRIPGGKAVVRLLQLLEARGYEDLSRGDRGRGARRYARFTLCASRPVYCISGSARRPPRGRRRAARRDPARRGIRCTRSRNRRTSTGRIRREYSTRAHCRGAADRSPVRHGPAVALAGTGHYSERPDLQPCGARECVGAGRRHCNRPSQPGPCSLRRRERGRLGEL